MISPLCAQINWKTLGQPCDSTAAVCAGSLICVEGECAILGDAPEKCVTRGDADRCAALRSEGMRCVDGDCVRAPSGAACDETQLYDPWRWRECAVASDTCIRSRCLQRSTRTSSLCANDDECAETHYCVSDTTSCWPRVSSAPAEPVRCSRAHDAACTGATSCNELRGVCVTHRSTTRGESCTDHGQCSSLLRCIGGVCSCHSVACLAREPDASFSRFYERARQRLARVESDGKRPSAATQRGDSSVFFSFLHCSPAQTFVRGQCVDASAARGNGNGDGTVCVERCDTSSGARSTLPLVLPGECTASVCERYVRLQCGASCETRYPRETAALARCAARLMCADHDDAPARRVCFDAQLAALQQEFPALPVHELFVDDARGLSRLALVVGGGLFCLPLLFFVRDVTADKKDHNT